MTARILMILFTFCAAIIEGSWYAGCEINGPTPPNERSDTTSHNFSWQTYTLGDGASSVLNDVAIVNDTLAYAVGEIHKTDSLGNWDPTPYGLTVWNGKDWQPKRIMVRSQAGDVHSRTFRGVIAFGATDVWFGDGNAFHWDGQSEFAAAYWISGYPGNPTPILGPNQGVNRFWGTSSQNLYGVGANGGLARFDGQRWQKLASGTTVHFQDVWGARNERTGGLEILAVASHLAAVPQAKALVRISGTSASLVNDAGLPMSLSAVWFLPGQRYYITGDGVLTTNTVGTPWHGDTTHPLIYKDAIRGIGTNDIIIAGSYGLVSHWNGSTWRHYLDAELPRFYGKYKSVSYNGKLIVAVGWIDEKAVILMGKRQQ